MPTSKRKMNRKRWKQPKIIGKRTNDRLGFKKVIGRKLFNAISTGRKPLVDGRLLLPSHDAAPVVCEQHALQPLALAAASVSVFLAVAHSRVFTASLFCLVFSKKFNIISALFVHQSLTLPQKTNSREGLF